MKFQPISEFKPHKVTGPENICLLFLVIISEQDGLYDKEYALATSFPTSNFFSISGGGTVNYSDFKSSDGKLEILQFKALPKLKN